MTEPTHLLVTGTYRSGTTFTERMLDNLPNASCASQPFPYLYLDAKRRFLASLGLPIPRYPIGSGFHDDLHRPEELGKHLATTQISRSLIQQTFHAMEGYSGAWTAELGDVVDSIPAGTLAQVVRSMHSLLAERRSPGAELLASKDVWLEEFSGALTDADIRMLIVVRDPRAVAASTIGPNAADWNGAARPLLYSVRLWRKSVAYALRASRNTQMIRFEDLQHDPTSVLDRCLRALRIDIDVSLPSTLRDSGGAVWKTNTSFRGETKPREMFGLTDRQLAFVEALAFPEMLALGYAPVTDVSAAERALDAFRPEDDPGRAHSVFPPDYSVDPGQLSLERERLARLRAGDVDEDEGRWFVLQGTGRRLATAMNKGNADG